jgi:hypothetical protein
MINTIKKTGDKQMSVSWGDFVSRKAITAATMQNKQNPTIDMV